MRTSYGSDLHVLVGTAHNSMEDAVSQVDGEEAYVIRTVNPTGTEKKMLLTKEAAEMLYSMLGSAISADKEELNEKFSG